MEIHKHGRAKNISKSHRIATTQKKGIKQFFQLGEVGGYFFRKKDPSRPSDVNIRMMHGINKISIIVFLLGIIYIVLRRFL